MDISFIYYIATPLLAVGAFLLGQKSKAKVDGVAEGKMLAEISFLRNEFAEMKTLLKESQDGHQNIVQALRTEFKESIKRVHDKIDNHICRYHAVVHKNEG